MDGASHTPRFGRWPTEVSEPSWPDLTTPLAASCCPVLALPPPALTFDEVLPGADVAPILGGLPPAPLPPPPSGSASPAMPPSPPTLSGEKPPCEPKPPAPRSPPKPGSSCPSVRTRPRSWLMGETCKPADLEATVPHSVGMISKPEIGENRALTIRVHLAFCDHSRTGPSPAWRRAKG